jgi:hypothetical protein
MSVAVVVAGADAVAEGRGEDSVGGGRFGEDQDWTVAADADADADVNAGADRPACSPSLSAAPRRPG